MTRWKRNYEPSYKHQLSIRSCCTKLLSSLIFFQKFSQRRHIECSKMLKIRRDWTRMRAFVDFCCFYCSTASQKHANNIPNFTLPYFLEGSQLGTAELTQTRMWMGEFFQVVSTAPGSWQHFFIKYECVCACCRHNFQCKVVVVVTLLLYIVYCSSPLGSLLHLFPSIWNYLVMSNLNRSSSSARTHPFTSQTHQIFRLIKHYMCSKTDSVI